MFKKLIMALLSGLACAGLFVVPVNAATIAGIFAELNNVYYDEQAKYHTAGVCSVLGDYLLIEPEPDLPANPWQENYILPVIIEEPEPEEPGYTAEDFLVGSIVEAEAGNEPEEGQRAVACTVFNRKEHKEFPNSTEGVVYQKGQYETVSNGAIYSVSVDEDTLRLVREERENRSYPKVLYFRTKHYFSFGTPLYKIGHHYFSTN